MNRLDELLLLWNDQSISASELIELKGLLASPEGRSAVAADFFLTGVVVESLRAQQAAQEIDDCELAVPQASQPVLRFSRRRLFWIASAAAVLLAVGVSFWFRSPQAPAVFAQFEQVQGETFLVSKEQKLPAQVGQALRPGQGIATEGADSEAVVQLEDTVKLTLGGDTMVYTTADGDKPDSGGTRVVLEQGELHVQVTRSLKKKKMTVETPLGLAVAQTEETALHVSDSAGVIVVRGAVHFFHKGTGKSILVRGGQYVVATADGDLNAAQLFAGTGRVWTTIPDAGLDVDSLGLGVAFAPDGKSLAAVGRREESGGRFGSVEPEPPTEFRGERCVQFSPDGQLLATTVPGGVLIHEPGTAKPPRFLKGPDSRTRGISLAFAPDGRTLAVGREGWRNQGGAVELWDVPSGTLRHVCRGHAASVTSLAFSPDGRLLASGSLDKSVVFWDPASGQERNRTLLVPALVAWSLAFSPDGKTLAIGAGETDFRLRQPGAVKLWDLETESVRATLRGHTRSVTSVVFSPDGQTLITGSADTTVRFWDMPRGREYGMLKGHQAAPGFEALGVALSADGRWLATVSFDNTVKLWKTTWIKSASGSRISAEAF